MSVRCALPSKSAAQYLECKAENGLHFDRSYLNDIRAVGR